MSRVVSAGRLLLLAILGDEDAVRAVAGSSPNTRSFPRQ